jgi:peptidoglycan/xylan/chitin deacetylase (PgdA/CDA1 family)
VADPLRRVVAAATRGPIAAGAVAALDRIAPRRRGVLTILTYHRVDDPGARPDLMPSLVSATPAGFAEQMAMVARAYHPVSLGDVLGALDAPQRLPRRAVLITVDDGYRDFLTNAWPVLKAHRLPVTLFVATAFAADPSRRFWWDRLWAAVSGAQRSEPLVTPLGALPVRRSQASATVARLRTWLKELDHDDAMVQVDRIVAELGDGATSATPAVLGWDELRTLAADGVTLAPHTRDHPLLDRVPVDRAIDEIRGSLADLEREIGPGTPIPRVLAYPSGAHSGSAVDAARQAGMDVALTTDRGGNDLRRADRLLLRRINVGGRTGTPLVRAQLAWAGAIDARR